MMKNPKTSLRIGLVVPHIFLHDEILPHVIFSPGRLALALANGLTQAGASVTLFTPGPVKTLANNITANLGYFETELANRGDTYLDLLKKHPFTFITLARQVQSEIIAKAYAMANSGEFDIIHIYTNEEDIALPFAKLVNKPVVFTHHDPFNFLVKYKNLFPKYADLNWISMSLAQRQSMPPKTNWVGNIYHGLDPSTFQPSPKPTNDYIAYLGRIIEPKGLHLAIEAAKRAGVKLRIAGKHYAGTKDQYWQTKIEPELSINVEYLGFINNDHDKSRFLANAQALIVPSTYEEPFGMVSIEALASGTPVIGLDSGATKEIIINNQTGIIVHKAANDAVTVANLVQAIHSVGSVSRKLCRESFEERFTLQRMCWEHLNLYEQLTK